eukprot:CAMPEP_0204907188 /NCGR_PEP_ID=MMETSP1397-20131031/6388_1 /ASSEMBLY_ACC=CAM_ASM_000891 /TAXON_ID=49980 /ORGANISM="Climacostomum Climacostomum virens, Strain Stock W-24" /LENGTH=152 /DNA_ID=CAMNT_0052076243 /DNA_START=295 /DNA_END=753 /DNA_ORIENTATION=+
MNRVKKQDVAVASCNDDAVDESVPEELEEVLVVEEPNAVPHPRTVVVHPHNAAIAYGAMMSPSRAFSLTLSAISRLTPHVVFRQIVSLVGEPLFVRDHVEIRRDAARVSHHCLQICPHAQEQDNVEEQVHDHVPDCQVTRHHEAVDEAVVKS